MFQVLLSWTPFPEFDLRSPCCGLSTLSLEIPWLWRLSFSNLVLFLAFLKLSFIFTVYEQ